MFNILIEISKFLDTNTEIYMFNIRVSTICRNYQTYDLLLKNP